MFHPREVLMWQFNGHLSLRRFSLSSGRDVPDDTSIAWSSCPQQYQRWTWREDSMTLNKQIQWHLARPPRQATGRLCCWASESVLLVERKLIVAGTLASFCNKLGWGAGNYLPVILNLTYIILLQALWTCLVHFVLLNFLSQNCRTGANVGDVSEGNRPVIGPRWRWSFWS